MSSVSVKALSLLAELLSWEPPTATLNKKTYMGLVILIHFYFVERAPTLVLYNRQTPEAANLLCQGLLLAVVPSQHTMHMGEGYKPSSVVTSPPSLPCPA